MLFNYLLLSLLATANYPYTDDFDSLENFSLYFPEKIVKVDSEFASLEFYDNSGNFNATKTNSRNVF